MNCNLYCKSLTWCSILIHETFHILNTSKQKKGENNENLLKIVSSVYKEHGLVYLYNLKRIKIYKQKGNYYKYI